jgi:hypothetical protein
MEEEAAAAAAAEDGNEEFVITEAKLAMRQKQIDYGKNTLAYQRYLEQVPKYAQQKLHADGDYRQQLTDGVHAGTNAGSLAGSETPPPPTSRSASASAASTARCACWTFNTLRVAHQPHSSSHAGAAAARHLCLPALLPPSPSAHAVAAAWCSVATRRLR